jgi:hypothetical protein
MGGRLDEREGPDVRVGGREVEDLPALDVCATGVLTAALKPNPMRADDGAFLRLLRRGSVRRKAGAAVILREAVLRAILLATVLQHRSE